MRQTLHPVLFCFELWELNGSLYFSILLSLAIGFLLVLSQLHKRGHDVVGKSADSGPRLPSQIIPLPLNSCVTLNKLLNISVPQFPYLWNGDNNTYLMGLLCHLNDLIHVTQFT